MTGAADTAAASAAEGAADLRGAGAAFAELAERALAGGDRSAIPSHELARVMSAATKLYAANAEAEGTLAPPISAETVTPTEVVVVVSEMLRAVNLNLFDLAMWYRRAR
jgi:hypothetical protein